MLPLEPPTAEPTPRLSVAEAGSRIYAALHKRFAPPEWAFMCEVYRSTGTHSNERRADAVAMELYPSRGLHLQGFEVKASRSDWLRELKSPQKVEQGVYGFCLHWWVVTIHGVVKPGELPATWGLLVYKQDGRLHAEVPAPKLSPAEAPTWGLLGSLLRRCTECSTPNQAVEAAVEELATARLAGKAKALADLERDHNELREAIFAFEDASGLYISPGRRGGHDVERIRNLGAAARRVLSGDTQAKRQLDAMKGVRDHARRVAEACDRECEMLEGELTATDAKQPED